MLTIDKEMIRDILDKLRQFQAKEEESFPEVSDDMDAMQVLADTENDAVEQEIVQIIDDLREDQQATLIALMYLGREDYSINEWENAMRLALEQLPDSPGRYLLSQPLAAYYIEQGLSLFNIALPKEDK